MSFLNQALLFGAFAAAIPIIIHLLNRRRFRKVPWAAMRFLNVSVEQNQRRMKLEDLILLVLRCILLALLAFAIARPVVEQLRGVPGSKVAAAVVIDNSGSMAVSEGEVSRLALAKEAARSIVERLPAGSSVSVATPFVGGEPTTDKALALRRVEEVTETNRHGDFLAAFEEAARRLESQSAAEKEFYVITDGQAGEWGAFSTLDERLREMAGGVEMHVLMVGSQVATNLGISRLVPSGSLPVAGQPFRIDVDVTNYGKSPAMEIPVQLLVDGQPAGDPWMIDEIDASRSETVTLYATLPGAGYHRVTAALNVDDRVSFDDQRTVVLRAVEQVRVLLVDGQPGAEARESETFFLRHALAPVPPDELEEYPVRPTVISVSDLAAEKMAEYEAIVLANVADLPLAVADRLVAYVRDGGGLMVFPGHNVRTEFYNTLLHGKHGLLPALLVAPEAIDEARTLRLEPTETNPLGLDEELLFEARFRKVYRLEWPARAATTRLALRYEDGAPALVESEFGLGKVFLFTSSADLAWNDFAVQPGFVAFIDRLLGGIVQHRQAGLNIDAGETLAYPVEASWAGREAMVYELEDPEALGKLTRVEARDGGAVLRFADTPRAGAYQATVEGRTTPVLFAAEPSARESGLDQLRSEQIERLAESASVIRWDAASGSEMFGARQRGSELWLPLVLLVIALAAVEMCLAQWFSRSK